MAVANVDRDNMNFTEMFNCQSVCCSQRADRIHMDVSCYFPKLTILPHTCSEPVKTLCLISS